MVYVHFIMINGFHFVSFQKETLSTVLDVESMEEEVHFSDSISGIN